VTAPSLKRSVALTFAAWIAIFQLVVFCLSAWWVAWPLLRAASNDLAALIVLSAENWNALPPERRGALQDALSAEHGLQVADAREPLTESTSYLPFVHLLQVKLGALTGHPARVVWDKQQQRYLADIQLGGTPMRFAFARERIGTNPPLAILAILLASLMLAFLVAHRVSGRLTRPLIRLERAVQAVGRGETPALPVENSVLELNGLSREFNNMVRQVRAQAQSRATLLSGVSHDLRSPIARLRMALELARAQPDPTLFDSMERYLEQMDRLIGDFIDYGRGISQRIPQPLELTPWLARLAAEHQATFVACGDMMLSTDSAALERVLANLLENARRHAPGSAPQLVCKRNKHGVQINVMDRGPGIPPDHLDTVFDPFFRMDPARQTPGSGLGLAIVREICRAHGWRIEIANRPDGGLQARITLPIAPA
jgi:two-component system, OmpR family, osmolarity sensor histidine kinase EnvZ